MAETRIVSLTAKLVEVMAAIGRVPKNGWNDFHKYHYALEADILEALRGELASRRVLLIPAVVGRSREPVGDKGQVVTHLDMQFTFKDADTGEEITRSWIGAGADKEDKGAYKALTGGEKYFLLKTFLIPTGDDPEQDETPKPKPAAPTARTVPAGPVKAPPAAVAADPRMRDTRTKPISEAQSKRFWAIAQEHGWRPDELKTLLGKTQIASIREIPLAQYDKLIATLKAGTDHAVA